MLGSNREIAMSAVMVLPNGKKLDYDRAFVDQGKPPVMGMMGGQKTLFEKGTAPKPSIFQRGTSFFTQDGSPITEEVAQAWFDDPDKDLTKTKALFREFLDRVASGKAPKEKITDVRKRKKVGKKEIKFRPEDAGLSAQAPERV
jgi:hypothetical protein